MTEALLSSVLCTVAGLTLSPGPLIEEEEKGPGTHCLHMLHNPKNLGGLDTIVNYSASLIRIPVCDIIVHLPYYIAIMCMCELPTDDCILTLLHLSVFLIHVYTENLRVFLRKRDACANSVYQALSPPLRSQGLRMRLLLVMILLAPAGSCLDCCLSIY